MALRDRRDVLPELAQLAVDVGGRPADRGRDLEHRLHELRIHLRLELVADDGREKRVDVLHEVEGLGVEQHVLLLDAERVRIAFSECMVEDAAAFGEASSRDARGVDLLHGLRSIERLWTRFKSSTPGRPRTCRSRPSPRKAELGRRGDSERVYRWASVTKPVVALAALVAAEEGTIDLDEPAGPPGSTMRHLLAHASGLPFEAGAPIAKPGTRRIYSNSGFEAAADRVAANAEMPIEEYLQKAVLKPLGMKAVLRGSPAAGLHGTLEDLVLFARELLEPTLIAPETFAEATSVQFPGLAGVIPDLGRFDPNDWGLGFELKGSKQPHFSGTLTSPRTFGHWGGSGTFLWVDPDRELALGVLTDLDFGDWAKEAWPRFSDAVVSELRP